MRNSSFQETIVNCFKNIRSDWYDPVAEKDLTAVESILNYNDKNDIQSVTVYTLDFDTNEYQWTHKYGYQEGSLISSKSKKENGETLYNIDSEGRITGYSNNISYEYSSDSNKYICSIYIRDKFQSSVTYSKTESGYRLNKSDGAMVELQYKSGLLSSIENSRNGKKNNCFYFSYDNGKLKTVEHINQTDDRLFHEIQDIYYDNCNRIVKTCKNVDQRGPCYLQVFVFEEFDEHNNWLVRKEFRDNKLHEIVKRDIAYR